MSDEFVSLATWLGAPAVVDAPVAETLAPEPDVEIPLEDVESDAFDDALSDVRRFRAALADALACRVDEMLAEIASAVLARELELAPADIDAIVARALGDVVEPVVAVRVHPDEAPAVRGAEISVVADARLRRGDAVVDVRCGTIDATLGVRLQRVLDAIASR